MQNIGERISFVYQLSATATLTNNRKPSISLEASFIVKP